MALLEITAELRTLLSEWKDTNRNRGCPLEVLNRISVLFERELTLYAALDLDPFDERHTDYGDQNSVLSHLMKVIQEDEEFTNTVFTSYLFNVENNFDLNCAASRFLLNILNGFNESDLVQDVETQGAKLLRWAKDAKEPLRTFACGLLSKIMLIPECPSLFKDKNTDLVPILIKRLKSLAELPDQNAIATDDLTSKNTLRTPVSKSAKRKLDRSKTECNGDQNGVKTPGSASRKRRIWKHYEYRPPVVCLEPLSVTRQQKIILSYLHIMGEYQEFLSFAFELNIIDLIFHYINVKVQKDAGLACNALLYLSSLLCHKKFVLEFVVRGGIQKLLEIPQPSSVTTMASLCLYYIGHNEDAVERICLLPPSIVQRLVEYLLWLLECAHVSGRCHAALFFSITFSFRTILVLFDSMDGLRKVCNMISTLKIMRLEETELITDDSLFLDREMAKNACLALKKYFTAHLVVKCINLKRTIARLQKTTPPPPTPAYQSQFPSSIDIQDFIDFLQNISHNTTMMEAFEKRALNLNIASLLLQLITLVSSWKNYNNRNEVMVTALEVLVAMTFSPRISLSFCQQIEVSSTESQSGIKILLRAAEGELVQDVYIQLSALRVLSNCVWMAPSTDSDSVTIMQKIWSSVRLNNGIKILMALLNKKVPITEADAIRALACKALCGLSENDHICQVLGKLPIFHNDNFQLLMREPVLSEHMHEHIKLQRLATILIERVTGKPFQMQQSSSMPMLTAINKADVVAKTRILYPQKELLSIVYEHLLTQGLNKSAEMLKNEAQLPEDEVKPTRHLQANHTSQCNQLVKEPSTPLQSRNLSLAASGNKKQYVNERPSLDGIVTGYLREQHAQCANPVATCPPFSLMKPHHCPEPLYCNYASPNITKRLFTRQMRPKHGGLHGNRHNRRYLYSKFRASWCIKDQESLFTCCAWLPSTDYVCLGTQMGDVKIMNSPYDQEGVLHSCHGGAISTCNVTRNSRFMATSSPIGSPMGALWEIEYAEGYPVSLNPKMEMAEDSLLQFSTSEERIVGTDGAKAHVYDLTSGQMIRTFYDQRNASYYTKNYACFGPGDDLLLNDGCLWDVRAKRFIHKFDKFNDLVSGVFHPSGLEIIINSEVWDIRTFHLLHTCPALDLCRVIFSSHGDVIYAVKYSQHKSTQIEQWNGMLGPYESTFRTFDSFEFSSLGTVDVKKIIYDINPDRTDEVVAVIESGDIDMDSTCRFYEIGRLKNYDDSDEDVDDEEESEQTQDTQETSDDVVTQLLNNIFSEGEYDEELQDSAADIDASMDEYDEDDELYIDSDSDASDEI